MTVNDVVGAIATMRPAELERVNKALTAIMAKKCGSATNYLKLFQVTATLAQRSSRTSEYARFIRKTGSHKLLENATEALDDYIAHTAKDDSEKDRMRKRVCLLAVAKAYVEENLRIVPNVKILLQQAINISDVVDTQCPFLRLSPMAHILYEQK